MIATGREPTLPPDVHQDAHSSPAVDDPSDYVKAITQQLQLTHQQMASPSPPSVTNPYQVGSLIYAMTTPPERASKLSPRWKGPFLVCQVPMSIKWSVKMEMSNELSISTTRNPQIHCPRPSGASTNPRDPSSSSWVSTSRSCQASSSSSCTSLPLPLRARCDRPQPRQPISDQSPLLVHGDLPAQP